nr:MAG TPA: hypothetical protein [Caudoviricetes sp.]
MSYTNKKLRHRPQSLHNRHRLRLSIRVIP